jgi:hypothetical protein
MSIALDSITFPSTIQSGPPVTGPERIVGHNSRTNDLDMYTNTYTIPLALIVIIIIILAYYVLFASLGSENVSQSSSSESSSSNNKILELVLWGLFVLLILLNGMSYIFNIDVIASIKNIFSPVTDIDLNVRASGADMGMGAGKGILKKKEVFHVSDNKYNYEDAKAVCNAYDSRLATYNEINDAYNNGADWCGYGWSEDQMALFPTQEEKWDKLQKIEGHQHDCGRPGINGGFIDNANIKFGINCFGNKPDISAEEAQNMQNQQLYPKTQNEIMFDKKVDYWRTKLSHIMVSPFNSDNWSII